MYRNLPFLLTPLRLHNLLRNQLSYICSKVQGKAVYRGLPYCASIEPANFCNLHCPHCPTGMGSIRKKPHLLTLADYETLLDRLSPTLLYLNLYFQGEPTLNRQLPQMVAMARQRGICTCVSTNGQTLDKAMAKALAEAGLNRLIVDLDGADEASYQAYRQGGTLHAACQAIRLAANAGLKVDAQCLLLATTQHQKKAVRRLARSLGAKRVSFKTAQLYHDTLAPDDGPNSRYIHTPQGLVRKKPLRPYCRRLWQGIVVNTYGVALPCCFDKDESHAFGNLLHESLYAVVNSKAAVQFRESVLTHRSAIPICRNCCE